MTHKRLNFQYLRNCIVLLKRRHKHQVREVDAHICVSPLKLLIRNLNSVWYRTRNYTETQFLTTEYCASYLQRKQAKFKMEPHYSVVQVRAM